MPNSENNKRIAKNTIALYFRMILTMIVSLYTVRIVFKTLGVVDYGIYNVVGGIVIMFSFLSNTMSTASQRFFAFNIGQNNVLQLKRTFSLTVLIYIIISVVIFLLAETLGLWFLNTQMVIPNNRIEAANWVYQFSILSFIVSILTIPYNAIIIARENMVVYAYLSIGEVLLKLSFLYLLIFFSFDKLKLYAILMALTTCIITFIYRSICKRKYEETKFQFYWNKKLFKTLINYSGWNLFGAVAGIMNNQGINILLNISFGPVVNASRAIAYQVSSAVNQFAMNFTTAVNPQIIKYYAAGENNKMMSLVINSSKYSFYLLFILSMPVLLETHFLLEFWLKNVPEYVVLFTRLVIINALIDSLTYSMQTAAQATGKIKIYQLVVGGMMLLNLPISYVYLILDFPPQITMYVSIVISIICLFLRLILLRSMVGLSIPNYFKQVFLRVFLVSVIAYIIPFSIISKMEDSFTRFILVGIISLTTTLLTIYFIGLSIIERQNINAEIKTYIIKKLKI